MSYDHWKTTEPDDYPCDEWKYTTDWTEREKADYEDWLDERQWRLDNGIPTLMSNMNESTKVPNMKNKNERIL